jgi:hypothetical protein
LQSHLSSLFTQPGTSPTREQSKDGWQDIASAPKNSAVLIYMPNRDYYGNDGVYAGMHVDMGSGPRWMTFGWAIGRDVGPDNEPTHWRSLPTPPAKGE